jgi:acetyl/propionyl-CoA carboxylase alpha subunit
MIPDHAQGFVGRRGRGIRKVQSIGDLKIQLPLARSEALSAFNDESIYVEKCIEAPRHVEVQILADKYGEAIHLGTGDCSIQRRHQKLWKSPPPTCPRRSSRPFTKRRWPRRRKPVT